MIAVTAEQCREHRDAMLDRFDAVDEKLDRVLTVLTGTNGTVGICERVRVLESFKAIQTRILWLVFTAAVGGGGVIGAGVMYAVKRMMSDG